jgi:hypothetical protein
MCVIGMNRIRAAYLELAPDVERYFVMSAHDDPPGLAITMAVLPGRGILFWLLQILSGTGTVVMILNAVVTGVIVALVALRIEGAVSMTFFVGAVGFVVALVLQALYTQRAIAKIQAGLHPLFPTPVADR